MIIQGDLQAVFDALYTLGVIDPVLEKDWEEYLDDEGSFGNNTAAKIISGMNDCGGDINKLVNYLKDYDTETLEYIAMEVAREFADYYARKEIH